MSNLVRMGRPKLPEGKSKVSQIGVRLTADESTELARAAAQQGRSQAEEVRSRLFSEDMWVNTKWRKEQIQGKKIRFQLQLSGVWHESMGELVCRERDDGKKSIVLLAFIKIGPDLGNTLNIRLPQKAVDSIVDVGTESYPEFELRAGLRG